MQLSSIPLSRVVPELPSVMVAITGASRLVSQPYASHQSRRAGKEGTVSNPNTTERNGTKFNRHICLPDNRRAVCAESAENWVTGGEETKCESETR